MTRSDAYLLDLLERAGYTLRGSALQRNFPKGLFKVCSCFSFWRPSDLALPEKDVYRWQFCAPFPEESRQIWAPERGRKHQLAFQESRRLYVPVHNLNACRQGCMLYHMDVVTVLTGFPPF